MLKPHGGRLVDRVEPKRDWQEIREQFLELTRITTSYEIRKDFENIAHGIYSPLEGPMNKSDYLNVLKKGRLSNDLPWTIPIILDVVEEELKEGDTIALSYEGDCYALLYLEEKFTLDKRFHSKSVYGTLDTNHPGVAKSLELKSVLLGGTISLFEDNLGSYAKYRLSPKETRYLFRDRGWRTIAGFQTRNPPHIGHEYVQKTALTFVDGLFINPLIGRKKIGDFKDEVIIEAYETLMRNYYLPNVATLVVLEMEMRYAGPREAIFHAIVRKNYGCTHFVVGRDHAGVGNYYGPYEAQEKFEEYPDLGISPLFFRSFFHCDRCDGPQNEKICPHEEKYRKNYSGTRIRELFEGGEMPSKEMMRPEVAEAILRFKEPFIK
jgi:sulfate adenylyltransferase